MRLTLDRVPLQLTPTHNVRDNTLGVLLEIQSSRQRGTSMSRHRCRSIPSVIYYLYMSRLCCSCTSTSSIGSVNLASGNTPSTSIIAACTVALRAYKLYRAQQHRVRYPSCLSSWGPRNHVQSISQIATIIVILVCQFQQLQAVTKTTLPAAPLGCGESFRRFASSTL